MAENKTTKSAPEAQPALNKQEDFLLKNKRMIIYGAVAVLAIIAGIIFWNNHRASQLEAAQTAIQAPELSMELAMMELAQSSQQFNDQLFDRALNGDSTGMVGFLRIAQEYSSTKVGNLANLYAGLCYAHMDKWQEAVEYLEKFDGVGDFMVSPAALGALGNAYAHVGQADKAVATLTKAAEEADNVVLSPMYYIQAGEILESQGKKAEALKLYQKVKAMQNVSVSSPYFDTIDEYIERVTE
ncbi:MAG: tetratricopeptide repeat protein [Prevotella sp.]|nr:tetratricopeptide repeat protein [Prevotella sp.]